MLKFNETQKQFHESIIKSFDLVQLIEIKTGLKVKSFHIEYEGQEDDYIKEEWEE